MHKLLFVTSEKFFKEIGIEILTDKINNTLIENQFNNNCLNTLNCFTKDVEDIRPASSTFDGF